MDISPADPASVAARESEVPKSFEAASKAPRSSIVNPDSAIKRWAATAPLPERAARGRRPLFRS
jgi:hypothetical protein